VVLNLQEATYTSGDKTGEPLDLTNIHIVSFWGNGKGTITLNEMYLTNNDDYSPINPDGIELVKNQSQRVDVYSVQGTCLRRNVDTKEALQGLPRGIYIIGGKKYTVK
jgi:hypothetical protein